MSNQINTSMKFGHAKHCRTQSSVHQPNNHPDYNLNHRHNQSLTSALSLLILAGTSLCLPAFASTPTTPAASISEREVPQSQPQTPPTRRPPRGTPPPPPVTQPTPAPTTPDPSAPSPDPNAPKDPNAPATPANPAAPITPSPASPIMPAPATTPNPNDTSLAPDPKAPKLGEKILTRSQQRDWILTARITVHSDNARQKERIRDPRTGKTAELPKITPFNFETLSMVFPMVLSTAGSNLIISDYKGVLKLEDREVDSSVTVLKGYAGGLQLGRWDAVERPAQTQARQVSLEIEIPTTCYRLTFNEAEANKVPWPTESWPEAANSTFASQLWLDSGVNDQGKTVAYDPSSIDAAIEKYLREAGVDSAKSISPTRLAKLLTQKVWRDVQPSGNGLTFRSGTGQLAGIKVQSPFITLETGRGSEHDIPALLCTLLRRAGLPARVVIGYDSSKSDDGFLKEGSRERRLRSWVEFYLFDEAANTFNWIPIDIVALRKSSSREQVLDRNWRYFGGGPDFDSIIPIATNFHPPTDVVAYGSPGMWGWFVTPIAPANAEQTLEFKATRKPVRGGDKKPTTQR